MKRNKVLLGLYVGLLTLAGGTASAQTGGFYEVGPSNVGGQISSIVLDVRDTTRTTVFAGATTGGLFLRSANEDILNTLYRNSYPDMEDFIVERMVASHEMWHRVAFGSLDVTLPIGAMTQTPDGNLLIGTGSDEYAFGTTYKKMSRKGMGIYVFNPETGAIKPIPYTQSHLSDFQAVNSMDYIRRNGKIYLFVATNAGLYRWIQNEGEDWSTSWNTDGACVFTGNVDQVVINHKTGVAYFTASGENSLQLLRIGNTIAPLGNSAVNPLNYVDISSTNPEFSAPNTRIHLAIADRDSTFLYAMVITPMGVMKNLFITFNEQIWYPTATETVKPILYYTARNSSNGMDTVAYNDGRLCGALLVDPKDPRRIIVGGTDVFVGKGYVDGSYFQWTSVSASEQQLNYGDYMAGVFSNSSFVHSGIQQIIAAYHPEGEDDDHVYYFATDGGIHTTDDGFTTFENANLGLNNTQVNGLAVCPDGTLISGASFNACPMIETHLNHVGGEPQYSWYDNGEMGNLNHDANILWTGTGGAVAASMFQQVNPDSRRTIFTSSESANIGRSYADYLDYTNTTTWTIGESFRFKDISGGPQIGSLTLWETDNNTQFKHYVKVHPDTLGYIFRKLAGSSTYDTVWLALPGTDSAVVIRRAENPLDNDTIGVGKRGASFEIKKDDKINFTSRAHADYPFEYTFKTSDLNVVTNGTTHHRTVLDTIELLNPLCSHMLTVAAVAKYDQSGGLVASTEDAVWFAWTPTDFTKVYNAQEYKDAVSTHDYDMQKRQMYWSKIYVVNHKMAGYASVYPRQAVFSRDGRYAFVNLYDAVAKRSRLVRISGFEDIDYENTDAMRQRIESGASAALPYVDLSFNGSQWFDRPISNITVDPRNGQDRLILTFEEFSGDYANVAIVNNATSSSYSISQVALSDRTLPAYTSIVEKTTGHLFVGTESGVFKSTNNGASWTPYSDLTGVPVTVICQQTAELPTRHNLTHTGITANKYAFAKSKWPNAIYFGTYGRGIFMDMGYVTDTVNEVVDSVDYTPVAIPTVRNIGQNSINLFPNPVYNEANVAVNAVVAGTGILRIYDINGHLVSERNLGRVNEGENLFTVDCQSLNKGMYLVNVIIGGSTATAKMIVR